MFERIREDIQMVYARDPAAKSSLEIFFLYPGLHAILLALGSDHALLHNRDLAAYQPVAEG